MKLYEAYLKEIVDRSKIDLGPKPIDQADLVVEIIDIILGPKSSKTPKAPTFPQNHLSTKSSHKVPKSPKKVPNSAGTVLNLQPSLLLQTMKSLCICLLCPEFPSPLGAQISCCLRSYCCLC